MKDKINFDITFEGIARLFLAGHCKEAGREEQTKLAEILEHMYQSGYNRAMEAKSDKIRNRRRVNIRKKKECT